MTTCFSKYYFLYSIFVQNVFLLYLDTHLLRKSKVGYADGVYHMAGQNRPNPFEISSAALRGPMGLGSQRGRNAMLTYFGKI
jgi:hypothetical protein